MLLALGLLSVIMSIIAAYLLLKPAVVYKRIEKGTLFFSFYYIFGILGQLDVMLWSAKIIDEYIFALLWFLFGIPTGAIGWLLLSEIFVEARVKRVIKLLIIICIIVILSVLPVIGLNTVKAEIFDEPGVPLWFSVLMKVYTIFGGLLVILIFTLSAIELKSPRIVAFTICLIIWAYSHHLLLNCMAFFEFFALNSIVAFLLILSSKL